MKGPGWEESRTGEGGSLQNDEYVSGGLAE